MNQMKNKKRIIVIILLLSVVTLCLVPLSAYAQEDDLIEVPEETPTAQPPVKDKGNLLERSIAGLVNNIADAMNGLIKFLTGFDDLDALLFSLPSNWNNERYPAPLDQETWDMLDTLYGGISIVAYGLFMLLPLVASFRFLGGAFTKSPRARAEAMQTLWRMVIAAVAIMAIPVMFRMFLIAANAIQGLVATAIENSYSEGLGISGEFLENIRTGSVLLTSIVRIGFVFISLQIGVLYAVRKIVLSTMYVFTPLMLVLWVIKKDITAASVWAGEMLTNSFLLTAYALSAGVVAFILGGNQSWVVKLLAVYMIVPLGNTLRNGLQNLFTRWAGIDEERIAGGFAGTMASAFGMQSITRMVGAMSMTFNGSTGGPAGGGTGPSGPVGGPAGETGPNGPWGQGGTIDTSSMEKPPTPRPIGFQIPPIVPKTSPTSSSLGSTVSESILPPISDGGATLSAGTTPDKATPTGIGGSSSIGGAAGIAGIAPSTDELFKRDMGSRAPSTDMPYGVVEAPSTAGNDNVSSGIPPVVGGTPLVTDSSTPNSVPVVERSNGSAGSVLPPISDAGTAPSIGTTPDKEMSTGIEGSSSIGGATVPSSQPQEMPNIYAKTQPKEPLVGRADATVVSSGEARKEEIKGNNNNAVDKHIDEQHLKRLETLNKFDRAARVAGTVTGVGARAVNMVGYGNPITRPIAEGLSRGTQWLTEKSIYGAGLLTTAWQETKAKVAAGEKTNVFREMSNLNKEYQEALRKQQPMQKTSPSNGEVGHPRRAPFDENPKPEDWEMPKIPDIGSTPVQVPQIDFPDEAEKQAERQVEQAMYFQKIGQVDDPDKLSQWL